MHEIATIIFHSINVGTLSMFNAIKFIVWVER